MLGEYRSRKMCANEIAKGGLHNVVLRPKNNMSECLPDSRQVICSATAGKLLFLTVFNAAAHAIGRYSQTSH
jgi:hypothetical protein